MPSKLITAPTEEPVSLAEAKAHLRVDISDDDALIGAMIVAARQEAEAACRRAFVSQQWKLLLDRFPAPGMNVSSATWYGPQWGNSPGPLTTLAPEGTTGYEILLTQPPLISIDSVKYIDVDGTQQTMASTDYKVDSVTEPARLVPAYGKSWPGTRNEINAVEVTFTCGYGAPSAVPEAIKAWMKLRIGAMYENRESDVALLRGSVGEMPFADKLLAPFRALRF